MEISTLHRSTTGARLGGVCAALSDHWRVDPLLVRLAAVLLGLSGGIGLVLYAAAWLAMPAAEGRPAPIDGILPGARQAPKALWWLAIGVAVVVVSALLGWLLPFGFAPALTLAAVWWFGVRGHRPAEQQDQPHSPAGVPPAALSQTTDFTRAAESWQRRVQEHLANTQQAAPEPPRPDPGYTLEAFLSVPDPVGLYADDDRQEAEAQQTPTADRERSLRRRMGWLALLTAGLGMLVVGGVDIVHRVEWYAYPAAAGLGLGLVLLACTWLPRPRGLVTVSVVLMLATLGGVTQTEGADTAARVAYTSVTEMPASTSFEGGEHEVDLSALRPDQDVRHRISQDAGELRVLVPRGSNVTVTWRMDAGVADVLGTSAGGLDNGDTVSRVPEPGRATIHLDVRMDVGHLEVVER